MAKFVKEIGIKKEGEVIEYHGITLADEMVGQGLKKDEDGVVSVEKLVKTTWAELKALRDEAKLNAGTFYRITDYVTTTTQSETKSANHPFDVIVLALSENTLCEDAKAILREGDTYFADSDLSAWELKYCLDNDKTRFAWADVTNGKGVIYRMVDEKRNDCPYDFKNILFYNTKLTSDTTSDKYYYTFSYVNSGVLYDGTTEKQVKFCYGNVIGEYRNSGVLQLNKNVFRNTSFVCDCQSNTLGDKCYSNTFGNFCSYNTLGDFCYSNTFRDNLHNRHLDTGKTSITLNEEFYDDGSGQLVPIKHPDLSTQPSILPYKFMGQYVYEQLIPYPKGSDGITSFVFSKSILAVDKPIFLDAFGFGYFGSFPCEVTLMWEDRFEIINRGTTVIGWDYIRIVYTSMPEKGGDYYGYNEY